MGLAKILQYGFLAFVFLLPFQTVFLWREPFIYGEKWQYGTIGLYAVDILLAIILGVALVRWRERIVYHVLRIKYGATEVAMILLVAWVGISIVWAPDPLLAGYFFLKLLLGAGIFFVTRSLDPLSIKKVVFTLLLAGVLQSGIGIAQFLSQQSWNSTLLGMSAHESWQAGSSVLKIEFGRFLRAYGTFPHPNMLGGFLVVVFVLGVAYQVLRMKEIGRGYRITRIVGLLIVFLGLILTFSRTAWIGAVVSLCVLGGLVFWQKERDARRHFSNALLVFLLAGGVFSTILSPYIFPRFDGATIEREGSVSERVQSFYDAKTVMDQTPLFFGTGAGNFTERLLYFEGSRPVWTLQPVHNVLVLVLAEIGVIGLFLWFLFLGTILLSWKRYLTLQKSQSVRVIFAIALLALVPSLFLDHWLWSSHFGLFFLFLLLGLSQSKDENTAN